MLANVADLSKALLRANTFKFGKFNLPSGCVVNAYFDLTIIFSSPSLVDEICNVACSLFETKGIAGAAICGVSYSGIPFSVLLSSKLKKPLLLRNKEILISSEEKRIEGNVFPGKHCVVIEEVMCSGTSTLEVIKDIENTGMLVKDVVVIMDLQQGGVENLGKLGYEVHALCKITEVAKILYDEKEITEDQYNDVLQGWVDLFAVNGDCITNTNLSNRRAMPYEDRIELCKSKVAKKLLQIMCKKETNLCVDFATEDVEQLLKVADLIGPYICILILHLDGMNSIISKQMDELRNLAVKHNFLLMDDRKLSEEEEDIAKAQCKKIFDYVDLLTVHAISGSNIIKTVNGLIHEMPEKGIFIVGFPSIKDALVGSTYEKSAINLAEEHFENVTGFLCYKGSNLSPNFIHLMPDTRSSGSVSSNISSEYYTLEVLVNDIGADVAILQHSDFETVHDIVREKKYSLWNAYMDRRKAL